MGDSIQLGDVTIDPGERQSIDLPIPTFYSRTPVSLPVHVINGRKEGPVLFVCAAIHGNEINGVEIIRRLLKKEQISNIKGALIAVPVVNVYGFISKSRYLPDRRDLNRSFPGSESGSMASRLAHTFMREVVSQSTHGIDLHTGAIGRDNLPQIRAKVIDAPKTADMACAFGSPVVLESALRDGSLRQAVIEHGIPVLVYEAGEALRFNEVAIRAGVKGIINVMRHLGMLPRKKQRQSKPFLAKKSRWVRASQSGVLRAVAALGAQVKEGETIGWVADPFGGEEVDVLANTSGIIIGRTNLPLVHAGDALFHVAQFATPEDANESVEAFQDAHDPENDTGLSDEPVIV